MLGIELRQVDLRGRTVVLCREVSTTTKDRELGIYTRSWLLTVRGGSVVGDWLDMLERSGLTKYLLKDEFGR